MKQDEQSRMRRSLLIAVSLGLAASVLSSCSAAPATPQCSDGFISWMGSSETYGQGSAVEVGSPELEGLLPAGVTPTCAFADESGSTAAVAVLVATPDEAQELLDSVKSTFASTSGLTQATDGDSAFAFMSDDHEVFGAEMRDGQFLKDVGADGSGGAVVIVYRAES